MSLVHCEINLKALAHNYAELRKLALRNMSHNSGIMTVIKADAYGHGMIAIARTLDGLGCKFFGVSNVQEGEQLRKGGFQQKILLFESTMPADAPLIVAHQLTATVCNLDFAKALESEAKRQKIKVPVHVKVDTGMGRLGVDEGEVMGFVDQLRTHCPNLELEGIYTHFPVADSDRKFTLGQMRKFRDIVFSLENKFITFKYVHAGNSMGLGDYKSELFNLARPGLMLYGQYPSEDLKAKIKLLPLMQVKAKIIFVKTIAKGAGISYGHTFKAKDDMTIVVLPIGYSNGYLRALSNKAFVLIAGVRCPVVGRVTMDQIMVDVSALALSGHLPEIGDEAVLIGTQKNEEITADDLAQWAGTISYEILCALGSRIERQYVH